MFPYTVCICPCKSLVYKHTIRVVCLIFFTMQKWWLCKIWTLMSYFNDQTTPTAHSSHTATYLFSLLQPGTSGALQTPRSSLKACMPSLWCWVSHALPTSCPPTKALVHCRSLWGVRSKTSSSSWSSSSWCLWPSWLACSTCTRTTLEPSIILPSPREFCLAVREWLCDEMWSCQHMYMSFQIGRRGVATWQPLLWSFYQKLLQKRKSTDVRRSDLGPMLL